MGVVFYRNTIRRREADNAIKSGRVIHIPANENDPRIIKANELFRAKDGEARMLRKHRGMLVSFCRKARADAIERARAWAEERARLLEQIDSLRDENGVLTGEVVLLKTRKPGVAEAFRILWAAIKRRVFN
jgi:hypothetical protein